MTVNNLYVVAFQTTEYEYEPELEESYRKSMFKSFNKTLDDGFFPMVILDCVNDKVEHFDHFWSTAKQKGFEVLQMSPCRRAICVTIYLQCIAVGNCPQLLGEENVRTRKSQEVRDLVV